MSESSLTYERLREIDSRCERFEDALRAGQGPRIEDYLGGLEGAVLDRLRFELLKLEQELAGPSPTVPARPQQPRQAQEEAFREAGYELLDRIGRGGMGAVYLARQAGLGRLVAVKVLKSDSPELAERLLVEARLTARLSHPNVVQIHEVGEVRGLPFLVLELCEGGNLAGRLRDGPMPPREAAALVAALARGVQHAHEARVIHRDIKPANVLLHADGTAKLTDFGLARQVDVGPGLTATGAIMGTPSYMAPEQADGRKDVGPPADVYALGALLYECLTGRPPFRGPDAMSTLLQVTRDDPVPPRRLQADVPADLDAVALKCLEKAPARRYASAGELADDLGRFLEGRPTVARPAGALAAAWKWARRQPYAAALWLVVVLAATVGLPFVTGLWLSADWERQQKEWERDRAREAQDRAKESEGRAKKSEGRANETARRLARSVYAGIIGLAYRDYLDGDLEGARRRLDLCLPGREDTDLRRWEWFYLRRLCSAGQAPLVKHTGPTWNVVHAIAPFRDGKFLTAAGVPDGPISGQVGLAERTPGQVKLWNASGRPLATIVGHTGAVWAAALRADGRVLAAGGADGKVRLYDGPKLVPRFGALRVGGPITSLAFSGPRLAIASTRGAFVWDTDTRKALLTVKRDWHNARLAFASGGRLLFVVSERGRMEAWELEGRRPLELAEAPANCRAIAARDEPPLLAVARGPAVELYHPDGPRLLRRLDGHTGDVLALAFGPGGIIASADSGRTVRLWDAASGRPLHAYRGHPAAVTALAFTADGRLLSGSRDGDVLSWDVSRGPLGLALTGTGPGHLGEWLTDFHFAAGGNEVVSVENGLHLRRLDANSGALLGERALRPRRKEFQQYETAASNEALVAANDRAALGRMFLYAPRTGAEVGRLDGGRAHAYSPAISPDGKRVAFRASDESMPKGGAALVLVPVPPGKPAHVPFPEGEGPLPTAFSPDGRLVAGAVMGYRREGVRWVPTATRAVAVWDAESGAERHRFAVHKEEKVTRVAFSADGKALASVALTGAVRVWELASGKERFPPVAGPAGATCLAFSPDGERLAVASPIGPVQIFDALDGPQLLTLPRLVGAGPGNYAFLARVAFCPKGRRLAANNWDGTISVYDAGPRE